MTRTFILHRIRLRLGQAVMRPATLASLLLHAAALGGVWWWSLDAQPESIGGPRPGPLRVQHEVVEPDPEPRIPRDDLPELELPDLELEAVDVMPAPDALPVEPDEVFELPEVYVSRPPTETPDIPLRLAPGPRKPEPRRPPRVVVRPVSPPPPPAAPPITRPPARPPTPVVAPPPRAPAPTPLRVVYAPDPRGYYPASAARANLEGVVLVELLIDPRGTVGSAGLARSSGYTTLDAAALALARAYRFTPGAGWRRTRLPVTFRVPSRWR